MHKLRNDILLIIAIIGLSVIAILGFQLFSTKDNLKALVYVEDTVVLEIPLEEDKEYTVQGKISEIQIVVQANKIKITDSGCADKICMHLGEISRSNQTLTCLPNRVYIKIVGREGVDSVV